MDDQIRVLKTAAADYSAANMQYRLVRFSGNQAVLCTLRSDVSGVLLNLPASGEDAEVCIFGRCHVRSGENFAAGQMLYPDASGFALGAAVTGEGSAIACIGQAIQAGSASAVVLDQFISKSQLEL